MIWLDNFPLPPSVNTHLFAYRGRLVKSRQHTQYRDHCWLWASTNQSAFSHIKSKLVKLKSEMEANKQPFALCVDSFIVFHVEQVLTVNNKCQGIDADNFRKALLDGLAAILDIDDKHFFAGHCEKVTTQSKELRCAILRIAPMKPRTLEEIQKLMRQ